MNEALHFNYTLNEEPDRQYIRDPTDIQINVACAKVATT